MIVYGPLNTDDSGYNGTSEINILKQSSYHDFNSFVDTAKETTHSFFFNFLAPILSH